MKVAFLHSDKPRERILADAFLAGAAKHGHQTFAVDLANVPDVETFDVVALVGVKSNTFFHAHRRAGVHVVMLDKGYCRGNGVGDAKKWDYWRVAVDAHSPTSRLMTRDYPADRWNRLGIEIAPWRTEGSQVIVAGSSEKYHAFHGLKHPTTFAQDAVRALRGKTDRPLIYRPKPSWHDAVPVKKAGFSQSGTILDVLDGAWALVTHGSNACFEAMVRGVPSIILGDAVLKPISSTAIADIEAPRLASDAERLHLASGLAYHQFTPAEFRAGTAWDLIGSEIHA